MNQRSDGSGTGRDTPYDGDRSASEPTAVVGAAAPRLGGRYEIGPLLGRGGMAEVRRANDTRLGRVVAVKRLRTDLAADPVFQTRFRREAQAAAGLNHPNIVSVYDTGEETAPDGSHVQPFIVMEYIQGRSLREVLDDGRKVLPRRALEIVVGVLDALDYSHRAGIVHRDIKPGNVMLTPAGEVKVMDFGIARAVSDASSSVTQTAAVVGTAQYLSPEQARGETVDSRSDVYSTGCLLYELLTGRPPFMGDSPFSVAYQHVREQADPPSVHNPDVDADLDAIVIKALAKRVDDRYQGAAEMREDIQRHLDGRPVGAATVVAAAPPVVAPDDAPTSIFRPPAAAEQEPEEEPRRRRWPLVLLVLLLLGLLAGAVVVGLSLFRDQDARQVTVPDVTNLTLRLAERRLEDQGLELGTVTPEASDEPARQVLSQDPDPDETVDEGSEVDLVVSAGPDTVVVPNLIGDSRAEARAELKEFGLVPEFQKRDSEEPRGTVIETDPEAAAEVEEGATVVVVLSTGPVEVPTVVGLFQAEAEALLDDAGFDVAVQYDDSQPSETGEVLAQDPPGLTPAPRGSTVTITVSSYEEPEPSPTESPTPTPSDTATPSPPAPTTPTTPTTPSESPTDEDGDGG